MKFRTDLAVETRELYQQSQNNQNEIPGVSANVENVSEDIKITRIEITDEVGSKIMGKDIGNYITIEANKIIGCEEKNKHDLAIVVSAELKRLIPFHKKLKILMAGLGNSYITPDSLGPNTVEKVAVTRQFFLLYNEDEDDEISCVSAINPGVMGTTGLESAELIRKAAEISKPQYIIAIDSLAARNIARVSNTIQISDTGIAPGAGTGNMRTALNEQTTGVKVIAIGVPTVIDAKSLIFDAVSIIDESWDKDISENDIFKGEKFDMIVTSGEIDQVIKDFSDVIAEAINITLHPGMYS